MAVLNKNEMLEKAIKTENLELLKSVLEDAEIDDLALGEKKEHPLLYLSNNTEELNLSEVFTILLLNKFVESGMDLLSREHDKAPTLAAEALATQKLSWQENIFLMVNALHQSLTDIESDPDSLVQEIADVALENFQKSFNQGVYKNPFYDMKLMLRSLSALPKNTEVPEFDVVMKAIDDGLFDVEDLVSIVSKNEEKIDDILNGKYVGDVLIEKDSDVARLIIERMEEKYVGQEGPIEQAKTMMHRIEFNERRAPEGVKLPKQGMHMGFAGNPGTLKTTMAREYSDLLHSLGRSNGNFVELTREKIVGAHIGETEKKINEFIEKAMGGVLFIDEVHNLVVDGKKDK